MDHQSDAYTTLAAWLPRWCAMVVAALADNAGCDTQDLIGMIVLGYLRTDAQYRGEDATAAAYDHELDKYKEVARVQDITLEVRMPN